MIKSNMNFHDFPTPSNYKVTEDLLFILIQSLTLLPNLLCTSDKFGQLFELLLEVYSTQPHAIPGNCQLL